MNTQETLNEIKQEVENAKQVAKAAYERCERLFFEADSPTDAQSRTEREEALRLTQTLACAAALL